MLQSSCNIFSKEIVSFLGVSSFGFITDAIVTKLDSNVLFHGTSSNDSVEMELKARK